MFLLHAVFCWCWYDRTRGKSFAGRHANMANLTARTVRDKLLENLYLTEE